VRSLFKLLAPCREIANRSFSRRIERQIDLGREELRVALSSRSGKDHSLPLPPMMHHRGSSDFLDSGSSVPVSRSHSPHRLRNTRTRDQDMPTQDEDYIEMAQEEEEADDERREERDQTPIYSNSSSSSAAGQRGDGDGENGGAAQRRKAILARLGLKGVSSSEMNDQNGSDSNRGGRSRWGGAEGGGRDGDSDFTAESGGESAGSIGRVGSGNGTRGLRRRRYSMGSVGGSGGGRPRNGSLSTDEEGWR